MRTCCSGTNAAYKVKCDTTCLSLIPLSIGRPPEGVAEQVQPPVAALHVLPCQRSCPVLVEGKALPWPMQTRHYRACGHTGTPEVAVAEARRRRVVRHGSARPPAAAQRVRARQRDQLPHLQPQPQCESAQVRHGVVACMHPSCLLTMHMEFAPLHLCNCTRSSWSWASLPGTGSMLERRRCWEAGKLLHAHSRMPRATFEL